MTFKSAFGHSLRTTAPRPVNEFLEHLVAAVLGSKYNFELEPDGEEHFSITMKLANYDVAPGTEISEGTISLAEGVPEDMRNKLEDLAKETYPASALTQMSVGQLKEFYTYANSMTEMLRSEEKAAKLDTLKRASHELCMRALTQIQKDAEALNSPSVMDMDPVLAKGEASILQALRDHEACDDELRAYFDKLIEMHSTFETDEIENPGCCGHDHDHEPHHHHDEHSEAH
jgi:hypothetical protein